MLWLIIPTQIPDKPSGGSYPLPSCPVAGAVAGAANMKMSPISQVDNTLPSLSFALLQEQRMRVSEASLAAMMESRLPRLVLDRWWHQSA